MKIKRIAIIGISGTGKTTLARELSKLVKIPVIHLDEHIWDKDWKEADEKKAEMGVIKAMKSEKWIIEGYIFPCAKARLEKADLILYLDYSGVKAMMGGLKRWWMFRGKKREEMAEGCIEGHSVNWDYMKVILKRLERDGIEESIKPFAKLKKFVRLKSRRETNKFLKTLLKDNGYLV